MRINVNAICVDFDVPATIAMICLGSMAYGIHIAIAAMMIYFATKARKVENLKYYCYLVAALLGFGTVNYFISTTIFIYETKNPMSYRDIHSTEYPLIVTAEMMAIGVSLLCNSLLMHRCYVVWNHWKPILIVPACLFISAMVCALLTIFSAFISFASIFTFWPVLFILNVVLSALISGRIIFLRSRLRRLVGKALDQHLRGGFGSMAALVIESSMLYTVVSAAGIPVFVMGSMPYIFSPLVVQAECIASELIILRVILGQAVTSQWASATTDVLSSVRNQATFQHELPEAANEDIALSRRTDAILGIARV